MSRAVSETPPARPGRLTNRFQQLVRDPRRLPAAARASVGYRLSLAVKRLVMALGARLPERLAYGLIDRLYDGNEKYLEGQSTLAFATTRFNRLTAAGAKEAAAAEAPRALVFVLRGLIHYQHNLHNYIIGCALRDLGYRVSFVVCTGDVECCGMRQRGHAPTLGPPASCGFCSRVAENTSLRGFEVVSLNDYKTPGEEGEVERAAAAFRAEADDYRFDGIPVLRTMRPFLLRYFHGDYREIRADGGEVQSHFKSGIRFLLRYRSLLDEARPACVSFFNGLYFPESLLFMEAERRGIPSLFAERGMRRDSIFLSVNEPACHYRSDRLWESLKDTLTGEQVRQAARYLTGRMAGPEDPTGTKRDLSDDATAKYQRLAEKPYVLLFAPVVHDTASMEKGGAAGDFFEALKSLSANAVARRKRLVVRSHPDEMNASNPSHYTVRRYMADHGLLHDEYVLCLDSAEKWNPYRLAEFADAVVVYNGTLGMELPALGYEILNLGDSNYSGKGFTVQAEGAADLEQVFGWEKPRLGGERMELALKYLYYYVYVANISLESLLNETAPSHFVLARGTEEEQKGQIGLVKERLAFLLDLPRATPPPSEPPL